MKTILILLQLSVLVLVGCQGKKSSKQAPPKEDAKKEATTVPVPPPPSQVSPTPDKKQPEPSVISTPDSEDKSRDKQTPDSKSSANNGGSSAVKTAPKVTETPSAKTVNPEVANSEGSNKEKPAPELDDLAEEKALIKECLQQESTGLLEIVKSTVGVKAKDQILALMDASVLLCEKKLKEDSPATDDQFTKMLESAMVEVISENADMAAFKDVTGQWLNIRKNKKSESPKLEVSDVEHLYTSLVYRSSKPQIKGQFKSLNTDIVQYELNSLSGSEDITVKSIVGSRSLKSFLYNSSPEDKTKISINLKPNGKGFYDLTVESKNKKTVYDVALKGKPEDLKSSYMTLMFSGESWNRLVSENVAKIFTEDLKRQVPASAISLEYASKSEKLVRTCNFNKVSIACSDPEMDFTAKLK